MRRSEYDLRQLKRGFERLAPGDQELLREWFAVPAGSTSAEVCRRLLERAPALVIDGIVKAGFR